MWEVFQLLCDWCAHSEEAEYALLSKRLRVCTAQTRGDGIDRMLSRMRFPRPFAENIAAIEKSVKLVRKLCTRAEVMVEAAMAFDRPAKHVARCLNAALELDRQKRKAETDLRLAISHKQLKEEIAAAATADPPDPVPT